MYNFAIILYKNLLYYHAPKLLAKSLVIDKHIFFYHSFFYVEKNCKQADFGMKLRQNYAHGF